MTPEHRLGNAIRVECGRRGWLVWHVNVGTVVTATGEVFSTGLPVGFPDLLVLRPGPLPDGGRVLFIETKIHPRRPTADQLAMHALLHSRGFEVIVAYSVADVFPASGV